MSARFITAPLINSGKVPLPPHKTSITKYDHHSFRRDLSSHKWQNKVSDAY
jgi:hypothetical protein